MRVGFRGRQSALFAAVALIGLTFPAASAWAGDDDFCVISMKDLPRDAPRFEDYPVKPEMVGKPAPPKLDSADARLFRTMIRQGAAQGPEFAGHYSIPSWGCGSFCYGWALVDSKTGKVRVFPELRIITAIHFDAGFDAGQTYRLNSRLLVVLGAPNEEEKRDGAAYYVWTGYKLKLIRFYPYASLCKAKGMKPY